MTRRRIIAGVILVAVVFLAIRANVWEWIVTERRVTADSHGNFVVESRILRWGTQAGKPHGITRVQLRSGREYTFRYENGKFSGATGADQGTADEHRTVEILLALNLDVAFEKQALKAVLSFVEMISDVNIDWDGIDGDTPVTYKGAGVLLGIALGEVAGSLGCRFEVGSNGDIHIVPHDTP